MSGNATQGVILIMVGVLILYLIWSRRSPLNQQTSSTQPSQEPNAHATG